MGRNSLISNEEYCYLTETLPPGEPALFLRLGQACYEEGYIDDFGLITPKGHKALESFRKSTVPAHLR